jgi:enoyl-CoA hydratase/carnithine racemase
MNDVVTLQIENHIAEVTLNRPDKVNAMNWDVFDGLAAMGERLKTEKGLRAVILSGAGGNFSSGIDLMSLQGDLSSNDGFRKQGYALGDGEIANRFQKPAYVWKELQVPVIAAISGVCYGGGLQVALGADIRLASAQARLSIMEMKWGIVPDMGLTTVLPRLMRMDQVKDLVWSGRVISGSEATDLGLVTRLAEDPLASARDLALALTKKNPDAVRQSKTMLEASWAASPAQALRMEVDAQAEVLGLPNQMEAVFAQLQKRDPKFSDS